MNKWKEIFQKHREGIAYLFFGGLSTVVSWGSYAVFALLFSALDYTVTLFGFQVSMMVLLSNILSWVCAVVFAFVTNKLWVFESKSWDAAVFLPEAGKFLSARIITGILEIVAVPLLVSLGMNQTIFGIKGIVAKIVVSIVVVLLNYVFSKLFIFKQDETVKQNADNRT